MSRAYDHPDAAPRKTMNRREFLKFCAAGVLPGMLAACQGGQSHLVNATPGPTRRLPLPTRQVSATKQASATTTDWLHLSRSLQGTLVRPDSAQYPTARQLFNQRFDNVLPAAVAYCASPADVQTCLAFV